MTLLLIGLPLLVEGEEWVFRRGAEHRSRAANARRSVLFGLVHALIGVPIGVALALSVGGVYFTWAYLRAWRATGSEEAALAESTRSHLAYNLVIAGHRGRRPGHRFGVVTAGTWAAKWDEPPRPVNSQETPRRDRFSGGRPTARSNRHASGEPQRLIRDGGRACGGASSSGLAAATVASGLALAGPAAAAAPAPSHGDPRSSPRTEPGRRLLVRFDVRALGRRRASRPSPPPAAPSTTSPATPASSGCRPERRPAAEVQAPSTASPVVTWSSPNRIRYAAAVPNDPNYASQAAYLQACTCPTPGTPPPATTHGLAIIDSGVELNHPDLVGRLVPGWDFVNDDSVPERRLRPRHDGGRHRRRATNNSRGVAGADLAGQDHADQGARLRGPGQRRQHRRRHHVRRRPRRQRHQPVARRARRQHRSLQAAVDYATGRNVVVVAAAGNDGDKGVTIATTPHYPAACDGVIAVGATDAAGNHAGFSSYGNWVDVVAPGEVSEHRSRIHDDHARPSYGTGSGTSFSSPLVAGVAFLHAGRPTPTPVRPRSRTGSSARARDLGAPGFDPVYGSGMVDATAALAAVSGGFSTRLDQRLRLLDAGPAGRRLPLRRAPGFLGDVTADLTGGATAADLEPTPSGAGYWVVDTRRRRLRLRRRPLLRRGGRPAPGRRAGDQPLGHPERQRLLDLHHHGPGLRPRRRRRTSATWPAIALNGPILDSIPTPSGQGYYMVGSDGGIFAFGDARFVGSMGGQPLNAPVQSLVPDPDGSGYWLVASDGGVFAFDAPFRGSMGGVKLNAPVTGMVPFGNGYLMVATDGGAFNFSDQPFSGSLAGTGADPADRRRRHQAPLTPAASGSPGSGGPLPSAAARGGGRRGS